MFDNPVNRIKDILSDEELDELSSFFIGTRKDRCLDEVEVVTSRVVTFEEIREYIGSLEVYEDFDIQDTRIDF